MKLGALVEELLDATNHVHNAKHKTNYANAFVKSRTIMHAVLRRDEALRRLNAVEIVSVVTSAGKDTGKDT